MVRRERRPTGSEHVSCDIAGAERDRPCAATCAFPPARKDEKKRSGNRRGQGGGWQHLFQQLHRIGSRNPRLLLNAFQAQDDGDLVADRALHEVHPEVASLDREARFASAAHFALHAFAFATFLEIDRQWPGHAMDREVTRDFERVPAAFDFRALERERRKLFRIEVIRTLQALIAFGIVRIEAFHRHRQFDRTLRRVVFVENHSSRDVVEAAIEVADAEMLHAKHHGRMNRIDLEGVGGVCGKNEGTKKCDDEGEWFHEFISLVGQRVTALRVSATRSLNRRAESAAAELIRSRLFMFVLSLRA
jgi:hypothetical protein